MAMLAIVPPESSPAALIARVQRGDRAAFERLARLLAPVAGRIAARILGQGPDAEDAVQTALLNLWRKAAQFDAERGAVEPWFNRLVANACLDRKRTIKPVAPIEAAAATPSDEPRPDQVAERSDEAARVRAAIGKLNPRQRAAIAMFYGEDAPTADVAAALETTPKAVEGLLARARAELARILNEMDGDYDTATRR